MNYFKSNVEYLENGEYKTFYYFRGTNKKKTEYYYNCYNTRHRERDKPAVIQYNIDGLIESEEYYVNGEDVTEETEIRLKRIEILKQLEA